MTQGLILLCVPGLTPGLLEATTTPALCALQQQGSGGPLECPFPALTLPGQASILTGKRPAEHGIVANGWYWRDLAQILFWRQPHSLLQAEDLPTRLRREHPGFKVAKLFWWFNMYAPVDWAVTPRPMYPADGRKIPDVHTQPGFLRRDLQDRFGTFPLFHFWGPMADLRSTRWIADVSLDLIEREGPDLTLVYLPHLDYDFQRHGPGHEISRRALKDLDAIVAEFAQIAQRSGGNLAVVSEYGIGPVSRPVHPNRRLREDGLLAIREELGHEMLDAGASRAFAVADHQICHVYVRERHDRGLVRELLASLEGVESILEGESLEAAGLAHERSGDLLLVAQPEAWFSYYFWEDDGRAPDYARCVDIHRKPGYDPVELFLDPALQWPRLRVASRLLARRAGFRNLLDCISLDASLVRGSHGRRPEHPDDGPLFLTSAEVDGLGRDVPFPLSRMPATLAGLAGISLESP